MQVLITSDIHLGLSRKAHFTAESSRRREMESRLVLSKLLEAAPYDMAICGGDLFDKYSNPEDVIADAIPFASQFDYILAANHDVTNRLDVASSLELVAMSAACHDSATQVLFPNVPYHRAQIGHCTAWFVPHQLSQELFLGALLACQEAAREMPGVHDVLFTHCSYDLGFELSAASLNMPRELAEQLLYTFAFIFLGHEHVPRSDFDERLFVIGSHYPTAFDNLGDKRYLIWDTARMAVTSHTHWVSEQYVYQGPISEAPSGKDYYDLSGKVTSKEVVQMFKAGAMAVRVQAQDNQHTDFEKQSMSLTSLPEQISQELKTDKTLLALWLELSGDPDA